MQHTFQGAITGPLYLPANFTGGTISVIDAFANGAWDKFDAMWHYNNFMENGPLSQNPKPW